MVSTFAWYSASEATLTKSETGDVNSITTGYTLEFGEMQVVITLASTDYEDLALTHDTGSAIQSYVRVNGNNVNDQRTKQLGSATLTAAWHGTKNPGDDVQKKAALNGKQVTTTVIGCGNTVLVTTPSGATRVSGQNATNNKLTLTITYDSTNNQFVWSGTGVVDDANTSTSIGTIRFAVEPNALSEDEGNNSAIKSFAVGTAVAQDAYIIHEGKLYQCNSAYSSGTWEANEAKFTAVAAYDAESTYDASVYCRYQGSYYVSKASINPAESWNAEHWTKLIDHRFDAVDFE